MTLINYKLELSNGLINQNMVIGIDSLLEYGLPINLDKSTFTVELYKDDRIPLIIKHIDKELKHNVPLDDIEKESLKNGKLDLIEKYVNMTNRLRTADVYYNKTINVDDVDMEIEDSSNIINNISNKLNMTVENYQDKLDMVGRPSLTLGYMNEYDLTTKKLIKWFREDIYNKALRELKEKDITSDFSFESHKIIELVNNESFEDYYGLLERILEKSPEDALTLMLDKRKFDF